MDVGPFRTSRPADRGAANRPGSPRRQVAQPDEPQVRDIPQQAAPGHDHAQQRYVAEGRGPSPRRKGVVISLVAVMVVALAAIGWFGWSQLSSAGVVVDKSKYQAVFFTNGQVYFGKLESVNKDYMKLTDVYYLQNQSEDAADKTSPQQATTDQNNVQLIKLGDEIHGPEDEMFISRSQMLFYENLKPDGKVVSSIAQHKSR